MEATEQVLEAMKKEEAIISLKCRYGQAK